MPTRRQTHQQADGHEQSAERHPSQPQQVESPPPSLLHQEELQRTDQRTLVNNNNNNNKLPEGRSGQVTHRDHGEDGVDHAGADGGVDGLGHTGRVEDARGVVEDLREEEKRQKCLIRSVVVVLMRSRRGGKAADA